MPDQIVGVKFPLGDGQVAIVLNMTAGTKLSECQTPYDVLKLMERLLYLADQLRSARAAAAETMLLCDNDNNTAWIALEAAKLGLTLGDLAALRRPGQMEMVIREETG